MWCLRKVSLCLALALLLAAPGVAQKVTDGDEMYLKMREVGEQLRCQCGCSYTVGSCNMLACHFREQVNPDIREALMAGLAPDVIVEQMIAKFGPELRTEPRPEGFGLLGWTMPFIALLIGMIITPFIVKRWKKRERQAEARHKPLDERVVAGYEAAIERDLAESE